MSQKPVAHPGRVDFYDVSRATLALSWRFSFCRLRDLPDGREPVIVFMSSSTVLCAASLLEVAVSMP